MAYPIDEEEFLRQMAAQIRAGDMVNQSATAPSREDIASRDFSAQERRFKQQQAYANSLRGRGAPQGKTVGPSNIYVGPNIGESLEYAVNQGLGGYLAGKAAREDEALDAQRQETAAARYGIERDDKARTFGQGDRQLDISQDKINEAVRANLAEEKHSGKTLKETMRANLAAEGLEERQLAGEESELGTRPYKDPDGKLRNIRTVRDEDGNFINVDENSQPVDITGWDELGYSSSRSGSGATAKNPDRWVNLDGDVVHTYDRDGVLFNRDTQKPMPPGWIKEGGYIQETAVSGSGRNSALQKLSQNTVNVRSLATDFTAMEDVFGQYGIDLSDGGVPLGRFEKDDGLVGQLSRNIQDSFNKDGEKGIIYSSTRAVLNSIIRNNAGMSQTVAEIQKLNKQYGATWWEDPKVMAEGLKRLGPKIQTDIASFTAGIDSESMARYEDRLRAFGVPLWTRWAPKGSKSDSSGRISGRGAGGGATNAGKKTLAELTDEDIDNMTQEELDAYQ